MTDFKWYIESLLVEVQIEDYRRVVNKVTVVCQANAHGFTASAATHVQLDFDPTQDFTEYSDLTEEQVLAWVEPKIDKKAVEDKLTRDLEERKSPQFVYMALPWATT